MKLGKFFLIAICLFRMLNVALFAQVNPCTQNTPVYNVDLTGGVTTYISSPPVVRDGSCCGSQPPDKCVVFLIKVDPTTQAIGFSIASGAMPAGAMYYQIDCGPPVPVGTPICLNGLTEFAITFCKPGNNLNTYQIVEFPGPALLPNDSTRQGCDLNLGVVGLIPSTIQWNSITNGLGLYNNLLSCLNCPNPVFTPSGSLPPYIDYQVCGTPGTASCNPNPVWCDTIRLYVLPEVQVNINPNPAIFCESTSGITLTAQVSTPGIYNYQWLNLQGQVLSSVNPWVVQQAGTYVVQVVDQSYPTCPVIPDTVEVIKEETPVASAGADFQVCLEPNLQIPLQGNVYPSFIDFEWQGNGIFLPGTNFLNPVYQPTTTEISNGFALITLHADAENVCPDADDQVLVQITPPLVVTHNAPNYVCYGSTQLISLQATGGTPPYQFLWSNGMVGPNQIVGPGNYIITVTDQAGVCSEIVQFSITENSPISVSVPPVSTIGCSSSALVTAQASGGTGSLDYLWSTGANTSSIVVGPGFYSLTVTDDLGCSASTVFQVTSNNSNLFAQIAGNLNVCPSQTTTLTVNAFSGSAPYQYQWNTGSNLNTVTVPAGNYCVTITDANNCLFTACVTVVSYPSISLQIVGENTICNNQTTALSALVSGGNIPYTYSWSNGQTSPFIYVGSGVYQLQVVDQNGCEASSSFTVSYFSDIQAQVSTNAVSCQGLHDGNASAFISQGDAPFSYLWSPYGGTNSSASNLSAGSYTLQIIDGHGCTESIPFNISQPSPLIASVVQYDMVSCYGFQDGSISMQVQGGTSPYYYDWYPYGGNLATANNLAPGIFQGTVIDQSGCRDSVFFQITQPTPINTFVNAQDETCALLDNGTININVWGGVPVYQYTWSPPVSFTNSAYGLNQGVYSVTIQDQNLCQENLQVLIQEPQTIQINPFWVKNVSCFGMNDGEIHLSTSGGASPYVYQWSHGPQSSYVTGLSAGSYSVTVTDSKGCNQIQTFSITQPGKLIINSSPDQFIVCQSQVDIFADAQGGLSPYQYVWSNSQIGPNITVQSPGYYFVSVTDANQCLSIDTVLVQASNSDLFVEMSGDDTVCVGGNAILQANVFGGQAPYSFLWSNGSTAAFINAAALQNYCVTVTDDLGCQFIVCDQIFLAIPPSVEVTEDTVCLSQTGQINIQVLGSSGPYQYDWNNGLQTSTIVVSVGQYQVSITDNYGCVYVHSAEVYLSDPNLSMLEFSDITCHASEDGFAEVQVSGGIAPYSYDWSSSETDSYIMNAGPGIYSVTVHDNIGCTDVLMVTFTNPSALFVQNPSYSSVSCYGFHDASILISASGGTNPYSYLWWDNGSGDSVRTNLAPGMYYFSVIDSNLCLHHDSVQITEPEPLFIEINQIQNDPCYQASKGSIFTNVYGGTPSYQYSWSSGQNTGDITNIPAGPYSLTVTDDHSCVKILSNIIISEPLPSSHQYLLTPEICNSFSGQILLSSAGGSPPFQYNWSNGVSQNNLFNVSNGSYSVTITDQNFCKDTLWIIIPELHSGVQLQAQVIDASCVGVSDGQIHLSAMGGFSPYDFSFVSLGIDSNALTQLPVGSYTVMVEDYMTCIDTMTLQVEGPNVLQSSINLTPPSCNGFSDGLVSLSPQGGTPPYTFNWNNGSQDQSLFAVLAGTYQVTITDFKGCFEIKTGVLTQPATLQAIVSPSQAVTCIGLNNAQASVFTYGGTPPYTYFWLPSGEMTSQASQLALGINLVHITDAHLCQTTDTVIVTQSDPIQTQTSQDTIICEGQAVVLNAQASGNSGPYTYLWTPGNIPGSTISITPDQNTVYSVYVTDQFGCVDSSHTVAVQVLQMFELSYTMNNDSLCVGDILDVNVEVSGNIGNPVFTWLDPPNWPQVSNLILEAEETNVLVVMVSDDCFEDFLQIPVFVAENPNLTLFAAPDEGCAPLKVTVETLIQNPLPGNEYYLNFGDGTTIQQIEGSHIYNLPGDYIIQLSAITAMGCTTQVNAPGLVSVYPKPIAGFDLSSTEISLLHAQDISFFNVSTDTLAVGWDFGDGSSSQLVNPTHTYNSPGDFEIKLTVQNEFGCPDTAIKTIKIIPEFKFYVPNAFTPNGNFVNELFHGKGICINEIELLIFNRWGELLFESNSLDHSWDGTYEGVSCKQDVYVYKIKLKDCFSNYHDYYGKVLLIR